jgi:hypothetical protein
VTKILTFETNGSDKMQIKQGEFSSIYFLFKFSNSPEYFAHSFTEPAKVRMKKTDGTVAEFLGQLVCYYPGVSVITLSPDDSNGLLAGTGLDIEVEVKDVSGLAHVASRAKSLTVTAKLMP